MYGKMGVTPNSRRRKTMKRESRINNPPRTKEPGAVDRRQRSPFLIYQLTLNNQNLTKELSTAVWTSIDDQLL